MSSWTQECFSQIWKWRCGWKPLLAHKGLPELCPTRGTQRALKHSLQLRSLAWAGFLPKRGDPQGLNLSWERRIVLKKQLEMAFPIPYGFIPKAHALLWGFTDWFGVSFYAPTYPNLPRAHQATKYLCFLNVLGIFWAPHWPHCQPFPHSHSRQESPAAFSYQEQPRNWCCSFGMDKRCDNQGQCQQLNLKYASGLGGWDTPVTAPIQLCPSSQFTFHLSHFDHVNKENSEVY